MSEVHRAKLCGCNSYRPRRDWRRERRVGQVHVVRRLLPATLAPLEYIALVGGAIAGFVIWNEVPDNWVIMGAVIIISSGVFVVYRGETKKAEN